MRLFFLRAEHGGAAFNLEGQKAVSWLFKQFDKDFSHAAMPLE